MSEFELMTDAKATEAALGRVHRRIDARRRRWHISLTAIGVAVVGVASSAAALAIDRAATPELNYTTHCYGGWSTDSKMFTNVFLANDTGEYPLTEPLAPLPERVRSAIEGCALGWETGYFTQLVPPGALTACSERNGVIAVLPRTDLTKTCVDLGLTEPH